MIIRPHYASTTFSPRFYYEYHDLTTLITFSLRLYHELSDSNTILPRFYCDYIVFHINTVPFFLFLKVEVEADGALIVANPDPTEKSDRPIQPKLPPIAGPSSSNDDILVNDSNTIVKICIFITDRSAIGA